MRKKQTEGADAPVGLLGLYVNFFTRKATGTDRSALALPSIRAQRETIFNFSKIIILTLSVKEHASHITDAERNTVQINAGILLPATYPNLPVINVSLISGSICSR